jgi:Glycosyl hydrolases family 32 N-terminal domain
MRRLVSIVFILGCGDDTSAVPDAAGGFMDAPVVQCLPQGAIGAFYKRPPNPKFIAGTHPFADSALDTAIADPNLLWDEGAGLWHLYYQSPHGTDFANAGPMIIRHATSPNLTTWTFDETPSLTLSASGAWDSTHTETPSVAYNPNAPADRRFIMVYSGAKQTFPNHTFADYAIGAAFSADGKVFTRAGTDGMVLTGAQVYPSSADALVADPEIIVVGNTYHLWFSSFACSGTNCGTVDAYGIGHATSTDGLSWTVQESPVRSLLKTSSMLNTGYSQPSVVYDEPRCRFELWMSDQEDTSTQTVRFNNMTGVFRATSTTGTSWTPDFGAHDLTWDAAADGEALGLLTGVDVAQKGTGRYMVYVGFDDQNVPANSFLPTASSFVAGVMTLNLAARDAPP